MQGMSPTDEAPREAEASDRGAYRRRLEQDLERARAELQGAAKKVALLEEQKSASHLAEVKTRVFKNHKARMPATSLQQTRKHASPPHASDEQNAEAPRVASSDTRRPPAKEEGWGGGREGDMRQREGDMSQREGDMSQPTRSPQGRSEILWGALDAVGSAVKGLTQPSQPFQPSAAAGEGGGRREIGVGVAAVEAVFKETSSDVLVGSSLVAAGVLSAESKAREFATDRSKLIVGIEDVWRCWYGNPKISQSMHWQASMAGMVPLPPPTLASLDASTICEHTLTGRLSPDKLGAKAL
jgi:hypothetical protein